VEGLTVQQVNEGSPARWALVSRDSVLSAEARYGTLVHELAHLYCGHLGTPNARWWPDRQNLSVAVREFEVESVSYLVCTRLGIDTASDEYLAAYVRRDPATPAIGASGKWLELGVGAFSGNMKVSFQAARSIG
jgi:hypothetical protein